MWTRQGAWGRHLSLGVRSHIASNVLIAPSSFSAVLLAVRFACVVALCIQVSASRLLSNVFILGPSLDLCTAQRFALDRTT